MVKKTQDKWKIQLTMAINFFSSKDSEETHTMNTNRDNIVILMGNETDKIFEELFEFLLQRYQEGLEESVRGSEFVFDIVNLLHYKLHRTSLNRGDSYMHSPKWLKNKKGTMNPNNNNYKCFQYTLTIALNYQSIKKDLQRI